MKWVSELFGRHPGSDIYVVGTGPSLRVFPVSYLEDKITIGLNSAYRLAKVKYSVTVHPDLYVPEFLKDETPRPEIIWVSKYGKTRNLLPSSQFEHAQKNFYFFESDGRDNTQSPHHPSEAGRMVEWLRRPSGNSLYFWSSIAQTAAHLAANMGAKNVLLVGCDCTDILGNHQAADKPTRWKGVDPAVRYRQYYEGLAEVRTALRERGVHLFSLTPFVGLAGLEGDFERLCLELGKPEFQPLPFDRSPGVSWSEKARWYGALTRKTFRKILGQSG